MWWKKMSSHYVPSLSFGYSLESGLKDIRWYDEDKKEYALNWWEPNSFFQYDWLLTSVSYIMTSNKAIDFRKRRKIPDSLNLIIDSGGYQEWMKGEVLNPVDIIGIMDREADIGLIYDKIPYPHTNSPFSVQADHGLFYSSLEVTKKRAEVMIKHRQNDKNKLYSVLHGYDLPTLKAWYNGLKDLSLDGWCLAVKPASVYGQALHACFMMDQAGRGHGEEHVHVLGVSSVNATPISAYMSKFFKTVTFDTSTFNRGCIERGYHLQDDMASRAFFGTNMEAKTLTNSILPGLPCNCPVCLAVKDADQMRANGSIGGLLISLHNLYLFTEFTKRMEILSKDRALFENYLRRRAPKAYRTLGMFAEFEKGGMDAVWKYYKTLAREEENGLNLPKEVNLEDVW